MTVQLVWRYRSVPGGLCTVEGDGIPLRYLSRDLVCLGFPTLLYSGTG